MYESKNASRSTLEDEMRPEPDSEAPTPTDDERQEPPSLELLEESAAQLAALRQRAEYLLDQLSTGKADGRSRDDIDATGMAQSPLREAPGGDEKAMEVKAPTAFDEPSLPGSLESDSIAGRPADPELDGGNIQDGNALVAFQGPTLSGSNSSPPDPNASEAFAELLPSQGFTASTSRHSGASTSDGDAYDPPDVVPPLFESDSIEAYPIERHRAQTSSVLDRPVGATQPAFGQVADARFDVTATDVMIVEEEIAGLFKAINSHKEVRRENTGHALALLREAREIVLSEPHRIERAEYNIQQARLILDRARLSRRQSRLLALRTVWRLILWLAILGGLGAALQLYPHSVDEIVSRVAAILRWEVTPFVPALWAVVAGGAGGCLGTISFLVERMRIHQEFDDQYILRSTIQPLMGVVLGLLIFAVLAVVFNSLDASLRIHPLTTFLPAAIALPVGLWQEYVYALIFRLTRLLTFQRRRRW